MPEITHHTRSIRIAPRKMRLVIDKIRHQKVEEMLTALPLVNKRGADPIMKALNAAKHAAMDKNLDPATLVIQQAWIDEGPALKRVLRFSRGRSAMIMKKYSHLGLVLKGEEKRAVKRAKAVKEQAKETTAEATETPPETSETPEEKA